MSTESSIEDDIDTKIKVEQLKKYMDKYLSRREKTIIELRYGLYGKKTLTQREVAKLMSISRSYVSRIEKKALLNLKKKFDG
ncbi:MAG: sigma-70 family RNA polymerase sigma factor [Clostridia bacterium]|nr:sigma-70 family RNA polymerase sigma factor [Clostridia bacterium]